MTSDENAMTLSGVDPYIHVRHAPPLSTQHVVGFAIRNVEPWGRGVYSQHDIPVGTVLWRDPIIIFPDSEIALLDRTELRQYYFCFDNTVFICLGIGSLINHETDSNCDFILDKEKRELVFVALKPIRAGEQLTIDYEWDEYPWLHATGNGHEHGS